MATLRDIRRRIRAVNNIQQITRAMYMVAAAKLKRAEEQARAGRPYAAKLRDLINRLAAAVDDYRHPLLERREDERRVMMVLVTADRGLAGAYNANLIRTAQRALRELEDRDVSLLTVGRKGREFFRRTGVTMLDGSLDLGETIEFSQARSIARLCKEAFESGQVDRVVLVYSQFLSAVAQRPVVETLLPVGGVDPAAVSAAADGDDSPATDDPYRREYLFEPSAAAILDELLPRYVETVVYRALLEAKASELGARMTAMKNATDNAEELVDSLTLQMNRARQAAITTEIAEIVGGAEALEG